MVSFTEEEFTGVKRLYFRVSDGPCFDACQRWWDRRVEVSKAHQAYVDTVGGCGFYQGSTEGVGNGIPLYGVIFEGAPPKGWKKRSARNFSAPGEGKVIGVPDKRTAAGKGAVKAIAELPFVPSENRICKDIGFPFAISWDDERGSGSEALGFFDVLKAARLDGVFYISLPDVVTKRAKMIASGKNVTTSEWTPLPGMSLILKEEMLLDFARAKEAKATAAP